MQTKWPSDNMTTGILEQLAAFSFLSLNLYSKMKEVHLQFNTIFYHTHRVGINSQLFFSPKVGYGCFHCGSIYIPSFKNSAI